MLTFDQIIEIEMWNEIYCEDTFGNVSKCGECEFPSYVLYALHTLYRKDSAIWIDEWHPNWSDKGKQAVLVQTIMNQSDTDCLRTKDAAAAVAPPRMTHSFDEDQQLPVKLSQQCFEIKNIVKTILLCMGLIFVQIQLFEVHHVFRSGFEIVAKSSC